MYKLYLRALLSIKDGSNRDDKQTICQNLYRIMGNMPEPFKVAQFCTEAYTHIYGKCLVYPVEGSKEEYIKYKDRNKFIFDEHPYAYKRWELLEEMIKYCKYRPEWVLRYSTENRLFEERSQDQFALMQRAKNLGQAINYQYSIKQG